MAYRDVMRWLGHKQWFAWTAARLAPLDAKVVQKTGGRFGLLGNLRASAVPAHHHGAQVGAEAHSHAALRDPRTGRVRAHRLELRQAHHPAWALNLKPTRSVFHRERRAPRHDRADGDRRDREQIWQLMYEVWPAYNAYRGRAGRDIKVFVITPSDVGDDQARATERRHHKHGHSGSRDRDPATATRAPMSVPMTTAASIHHCGAMKPMTTAVARFCTRKKNCSVAREWDRRPPALEAYIPPAGRPHHPRR